MYKKGYGMYLISTYIGSVIINQKKTIMSTTNIYTNGISLFTLENYDKSTGVCHPLNITLHSQVSKLTSRAMHERGQLHYVFGIGDRKELSGVSLNRKMNLRNFQIF